jgi:hypothetical protein
LLILRSGKGAKSMKKRCSDQQIAYALREPEPLISITDVYRKTAISYATCYSFLKEKLQ